MIDEDNKKKAPNPLSNLKEEKKQAPVVNKQPNRSPDKQSSLFFAVVMTILFIAFFGAIILGFQYFLPEPPVREFDYGPYHFKLTKERSWQFEWQRDPSTIYDVPLRYSPYEVENVTVSGKLSESFNRPNMFITFDPTKGNFSTLAVAASELSLNMVKALQVTPHAACTKNETDACVNRPIVHCEDVNKSVILIKDEGDATIWLKDECIVLFGKDLELVRAVDRLLYQWYGVME